MPYTPSSLPSRYRPTGALNSSTSSSSFNYTPSSSLTSSYTPTRLGSSSHLGGSTSSRYSTSTNPSSSYSPSMSTALDSYQPTPTGKYDINKSPYAIDTSSDLYSPFTNTQQTAFANSAAVPSSSSSIYSSHLNPAPLNSRLSPSRHSPGPSTSGFSSLSYNRHSPGPSTSGFSSLNTASAKTYKESSPISQSPLTSATSNSNPKSKFFNRRNSSADLAVADRRSSAIETPKMDRQLSIQSSSKRSDSLGDPLAVPSVKDSWASGYLRRRKEAEAQKEEIKASQTPRASITKLPVKDPPADDTIKNQQEFMSRLMAAHSIVDELLNRRGLKSEDENKYLKHFEWVPAIEEELAEERISPRVIRNRRRQTVSPPRRSVSSESDSGLSMESAGSGEQSTEEIEASGCEFFNKKVANESCEMCVLMSGTEIAVEKCIKREEKPEVKSDVKPPETKSTKKLVRQKQHVEEITELRVKLPEKVKSEPKTAKKLILQNLTIDLIELRVAKQRKSIKIELEDAPLQLAFSKCAFAKCKVKHIDIDIDERIKLKPKQEEKKEVQKAESKSISKTIQVKQNDPQIDLHVPKRRKSFKAELEDVPLQLAFSKCAVSKCKVREVDEEPVVEKIKLKPVKIEQKTEESQKTNPFEEVQLKKVVKIQDVPKKKSPEKLQPFEKKGEESKVETKKPVRKLLKRQQTEPTLPSNQRQVGKLQLNNNESVDNEDDPKKSLSKPSRHLIESLNLHSMASRQVSARFRPLDQQKQEGMAEISVQHCSFYEVQKALSEPREKCLRIHLRLTQKPAETAANTQKVWPTNERTHKLVHRILDRRDILAFVEEVRRQEEEERQKKKPGKLKIEGPKPVKFPPCQPLIFTNTSVKLMQEKLKRQQANAAELQNLRGGLKRIPRAKQSSSQQNEGEKTKKEANGQSIMKKQKRKKIVKKVVKKPKLEEVVHKIDVEKFDKLDKPSTSKDNLNIPTRPISQCASNSSIASSQRSNPRNRPMFSNTKLLSKWERRILDEFRRHLNIPVLQAIYREVFCLKCKICPTLGPPRLPTRAHFQRRHAPSHTKIHLADLSGNQLLRLMAIFRPGVSQLARLSTKTTKVHRPRQFVGSVDGSPFGVKLQQVNRQRRPWIPYNQRKPKTHFVPKWRHRREATVEEEL